MDFSRIKLNRRNVLKAAGMAVAAGSAWAETSEAQAQPSERKSPPLKRRVLPWSNWSGNQECLPSVRQVPRSEEQLIDIVKNTTTQVRFVGSSHSFSALVPTEGTLISLAALRGVESVDPQSGDAEIWGGTRLAQIGDPLWEQGRALINMPDINTQTLAGAVATSTHGTGVKLGSMSSDVSQLRLVTAQGEVIECSEDRETDIFQAARTHLGALGAVSKIRLRTRPRYYTQERSWMMPLEEGLERAAQLRDKHRHFEMYALPHGDYILGITIDEVELPAATASKVDTEEHERSNSESAFRTVAKITDYLPFLRSPIINYAASRVEPEQRVGRSYEVFGNLRDMRFNEMEYSVPAEQGPACLKEILETIKRQDIDVIFPIEYRYIKADDIWLSPFYQQNACAISCHNFHDRDYKKYFAAVEPIFWKYGGRPHPGKIHTLGAAQLSQVYPKWNEFLAVRKELDPKGKFLNPFMKKIFGLA